MIRLFFFDSQTENEYRECFAEWEYEGGGKESGMGYCYMNADADNHNKHRSVDIVVVKQRSIFLTAFVLFHEICHATIWFLRLPMRWNNLINKYLHPWSYFLG
jgi:hypothetical protein